MNKILARLKLPAVLSLILVLPFMLMELVNRRATNEAFPIPLFILLFLLPLGFFLILSPLIQKARAGGKLLEKPLSLLVSLVAMVLLAGLWAGILIDQMPCFLGTLNCD